MKILGNFGEIMGNNGKILGNNGKSRLKSTWKWSKNQNDLENILIVQWKGERGSGNEKYWSRCSVRLPNCAQWGNWRNSGGLGREKKGVERLVLYERILLQLLSKMAPLIGKEMSEAIFLERFASLCMDPLFHVRKVCAANFGDFSSVVGTESTEKVLVMMLFYFSWFVEK